MYSKILFTLIPLLYCTSAFAQGYDTSYYNRYFKITTALEGDQKPLDIADGASRNNRLILSDTGWQGGQPWRITPARGYPGYYQLTTEQYGDTMSLGVRQMKSGQYRPVLMKTARNIGQLWRLTPVKGMLGYYRITTKVDGRSISLTADYDRFGDTKVILARTGDYLGQYWKLSRTNQSIYRSADLSWKSVGKSDALSTGIIIGGVQGGDNLYVCRARYEGDRHPGKIVGAKCNIGYGGREVALSSFDILVNDGSNDGLAWAAARNGFAPEGAVVGGEENNVSLYVCRVSFNGTQHPGKLVGENCNIAYGGTELSFPRYEVLVMR